MGCAFCGGDGWADSKDNSWHGLEVFTFALKTFVNELQSNFLCDGGWHRLADR